MNAPWSMGHAEWLEISLFLVIATALLVLLLASLFPRPAKPQSAPETPKPGWRNLPELRLLIIALPLELLWEIAQFPLYDVWHQNDWGYILYGLVHCTIGDLLILLVIYEFVALLNRDRRWYARNNMVNAVLFTLLGAGYTIFSEIMNARIKGTWGYTELMPLIPVLEIGGMPLLQWILIPPLILWFMKHLD